MSMDIHQQISEVKNNLKKTPNLVGLRSSYKFHVI